MITSIPTYPIFKDILNEWDSYILLADTKDKKKKTLDKNLWQTLDKSLPIILRDGEETRTWFVRVMHNKLKGLCIDIRLFSREEDEVSVNYLPTEVGITLPIEQWKFILSPLYKLIRKWAIRKVK